MARNGSGVMSIPFPDFQPGTTISSSQVDQNNADIVAELTNSLPRDGQAGMSGQLKAADGTVAAPGMAFGLDTNTGLYRIGADNIGVSIGGTKRLDISATGLVVTGDLGFTGGLDAPQDVAFSGDITPAQIVANQNDYAPTGHATASTFRLSTDASRNITGLAGGADGRLVLLHNVGSFAIVLTDDDAASTAANRFALPAAVTLAPEQAVALQYDSTSSRWRAVAAPPITADAAAYRANTTDRVLDTDGVWSAAASVSVTYAANVALNFSTGLNFHLTLTGNLTLDNPTNVKPGQSGLIRLAQDATGSRTLALGTNWLTAGGTVPTISTAANAVDFLSYYAYSATEIVLTMAARGVS